ncbi:MAG TPA: oligoendopeptidase F, partial [Bacteroidota bacterium]|nr:oligoendopeptidase F [Bacteroidota bacterium]
DLEKVRSLIPQIKSFDGKLESAEQVKNCFVLTDVISQLVERLYVFAYLKHHEDTTVAAHQALVNGITPVSVEVSEAMSFIEPELLALPEQKLLAFVSDPSLAFYKFTLENILRQKPHTLPKEQQALLAKAGILAEAPQTIFDMLNDADLKFGNIRDEKNREVELTHGRYHQFLESRDRRVRKDAFEAMFAAYRKQQNTIASIYTAQVRKNLFYSRALKYNSSLEMALYDDNIPSDVYTNLIDTVHSHVGPFRRYLALRKKMLGLDKLHLYDLSVPLVPDFEWKVTYKEATEIVSEAIRPLGDAYGDIVRKAWNSRWIDIYENEGKHSGAYSWSAYGTHPYILLNHEDTVNDLFTVAHEMGHAVHTWLSHSSQKYRYAHYTIFVAEIASTLNEMLLMNYLLKTCTDPKQQAYLLTHYADNFRGTLYVQTLFAEFEKLVHDCAERSEPLTLEKYNEIFYSLHQKYYGDAVTLDKDVEIGWMRIPHFYTSFYVYKYATGFSAANSFGSRILREGPSAAQRYLRLLESGGMDYPLNLLNAAGLDMRTPAPIIEALGVFDSVVERLEEALSAQEALVND